MTPKSTEAGSQEPGSASVPVGGDAGADLDLDLDMVLHRLDPHALREAAVEEVLDEGRPFAGKVEFGILGDGVVRGQLQLVLPGHILDHAISIFVAGAAQGIGAVIAVL